MNISRAFFKIANEVHMIDNAQDKTSITSFIFYRFIINGQLKYWDLERTPTLLS